MFPISCNKEVTGEKELRLKTSVRCFKGKKKKKNLTVLSESKDNTMGDKKDETDPVHALFPDETEDSDTDDDFERPPPTAQIISDGEDTGDEDDFRDEEAAEGNAEQEEEEARDPGNAVEEFDKGLEVRAELGATEEDEELEDDRALEAYRERLERAKDSDDGAEHDSPSDYEDVVCGGGSRDDAADTNDCDEDVEDYDAEALARDTNVLHVVRKTLALEALRASTAKRKGKTVSVNYIELADKALADSKPKPEDGPPPRMFDESSSSDDSDPEPHRKRGRLHRNTD